MTVLPFLVRRPALETASAGRAVRADPAGAAHAIGGEGAASCVVPEYPAPNRGAMVIVILVLVLASALLLAGDPVGVVLGLLAGAGYIGTEAVRRLTTAE